MKNNKTFSHFDSEGKAIMVDISDKENTERLATASSSISMNKKTLEMIKEGTSKKGDVLGVARIAGIMAAKKTADLIPLCHTISISSVTINFEIKDSIVAALTIYDMCKAVDKEMIINKTQLLYKSGGKSGTFTRND